MSREIFELSEEPSGYTILKYNTVTESWSDVKYLVSQSTYEGSGSRPSLFYFNDKMYAIANTSPKYKDVVRSHVEISEL